MALTHSLILEQIENSKLISAEVLATLSAEHQSDDAQTFVQRLVEQGLLTSWQGQQFLTRKSATVVLGKYVLLERLGQGAMGAVYKARHRSLKKLVAVKVLKSKFVERRGYLARFYREAQAAAQLKHQNIVTALDVDKANETHFLVMEFVEGRDLHSIIQNSGAFSIENAVDCVLQAARGLAYAHHMGIFHRDIKPANLLLDLRGVVMVLDMGLARVEGEPRLTTSSEVDGTSCYMAPEQARGLMHADHQSDIYSLGCTLWYLLTARSMYEAETDMAQMVAHARDPIPSLREVGKVPHSLDMLFRDMVAKDPKERCQSMTEVVLRLEAGTRNRWHVEESPGMPAASNELYWDTVVNQPFDDGQLMMNGWARREADRPSSHRSPEESGWWRRKPISLALGLAFLLMLLSVVAIRSPSPVSKTIDTSQTSDARGTTTDLTNRMSSEKGTRPPPPSFEPREVSKATGMIFVLIPAGTFLMGSSDAEVEAVLLGDRELKRAAVQAEQPQRRVRITKPFYLGQYEVTQSEYRELAGWNPSRFSKERMEEDSKPGLNTDRFPVESVSWFDALAFCNTMSKADGLESYYELSGIQREASSQSIQTATVKTCGGRGYRLPTEAEWEYACRAGSTTPYHFGSVLNGGEANVDGQAPFGTTTKGDFLQQPTTVDQYMPNKLGLSQMHGNVSEWCWDGYRAAYPIESGVADDPMVDSAEDRVLRGGSWLARAGHARAASRYGLRPGRRHYVYGFRVARTP